MWCMKVSHNKNMYNLLLFYTYFKNTLKNVIICRKTMWKMWYTNDEGDNMRLKRKNDEWCYDGFEKIEE